MTKKEKQVEPEINEEISKEELYEQKIKALELVISDLKEKHLREQAEVQNFKRRKEDELHRYLKYANEDMAKQMLPILDNFERAVSMDDENLDDELSLFLKGFIMIHDKVNEVLGNFEIKEIDSLNETFDPAVHQAVLAEEAAGIEANIVIEVFQKGYLLKDKVIRPAMVKVSK